MKSIVAITMGDPSGVGPELCLRALRSQRVRRVARPVIIGDLRLLTHLAKKLKLAPPKPDDVINLSSLDLKKLKPGKPNKKSAEAMIAYIEEAVGMAQGGKCDALVTAPINKESAKLAGFKFPGHTEFLAHLTKTKDFAMMLGGKNLKVILVTIHEPIAKVPGLITKRAVLKTIKITHDAFKKFYGLKRPRIAVCGLNPHAGEGGLFGKEDFLKIMPAVEEARSKGINVTGPLPPDTVFYMTVRKKAFDCVVCMYHDQGLIPLKLLHFDDGVNTTLGLPVIRTSPDHGTAYDIAWKGKASPKSMVEAIVAAAQMANTNKKRNK